MSSSKKLKMERLSPIPMMDRAHANLSDSCRTSSWCVTPKASIRKRKDCYAIESTSSPEVDMQPSNSQKHKKTRSSAVRNRIKSVSKKHTSTPLSGLIARKSVCQPVREHPSVSGSRAGSGVNLVGHSDSVVSQLHIIEELQTVDEDMYQMPLIGAFHSPLKPRVLNPVRHSEMLSPSMVFPSIQPSNRLNNTPLSGIITKTSLGNSRSLNDSIRILANADVEMSDEPDVVSPSIEYFESPRKPPPAKYHEPMSFAKDTFEVSTLGFSRSSLSNFAPWAQNSKQPLAPIIEGITSKLNTSVEMTGSEKKKRKRALDFSSQTFPVSSPPFFTMSPDVDMVSIVPPIILPNLSTENDPKLDHEQPLNIPELKSPLQEVDEVLNEDSEAESVIEGTPKSCKVPPRIKDDTLSGFTVCSSLAVDAGTPPLEYEDAAPIIEHNSPPSTSQSTVEILEEASNGEFPGLRCDLNLVCQDTSSDESELECSINQIDDKSCFIIPDVQGSSTKSPPLNFNCTRREIRPYESPLKVAKAFSEAINIGAFGSPDSSISNNEPEEVANEEEGDDIINVTTTPEEDEFVDESEQIRPNKRRKKGSLLERAGFIISRIDASSTLFDYEVKTGLRPSTGKFVSSPLVVCKKWAGENSSHFLVCKSLKFCKIDFQERSEVERTSIVAIVVNNISKDLSEGSVVLLHYPSTIVYCNTLRIPYIIAGNQLVIDPNVPKFTNLDALNISDALIKNLNQPMTPMKNGASSSSMKVFPFSSIKNLAEAALCQCLVDEFELPLRVLHFIKDHSDPSNKKILVLCCDVENNFGWIQFTQERDVKRATALEALHILADGALVEMRGFHVTDRQVLDMKTKNLLSYCLNETVKSDMIFIVIPIESTWVVSSTGGPRDAKKTPVSVDNIICQKGRGKRFLIGVASTGIDQDQNIFVTDSLGKSVTFIQGELAPKMRFELLSTPFFLDGVYYYDGKIFSDEYTKLIPDKLPWTKL